MVSSVSAIHARFARAYYPRPVSASDPTLSPRVHTLRNASSHRLRHLERVVVRTFSSSSSVHRSRRMFGLTRCRHRCAHCCPVLVPMSFEISLHLFPYFFWSLSNSPSSASVHGTLSCAASRGMELSLNYRENVRRFVSHAMPTSRARLSKRARTLVDSV